MSNQDDPPLRDQLDAAIANVRHQIEIQSVSNHYLGSEEISAEALRELRVELAQLEAARADLKGG
jgi:hypothetical protein